jgi:hypothetical protein
MTAARPFDWWAKPALLGLVAATACCIVTTPAEGQERLDLRGKLVDFARAAVRIEAENGATATVPIGPTTEIRIEARGGADLIQPGMVVAIDGYLKNRVVGPNPRSPDGAPSLTVYPFGNAVLPDGVRNIVSPQDLAQSGGAHPITLFAKVTAAEPLTVRGLPASYSKFGINAPGQPLNVKTTSTANVVYEVLNADKIQTVTLNLGTRIELAGEGARVTAFVPNRPNAVADELHIYSNKTFTADDLKDLVKPADTGKKGKGKKQ